ncbi:MAG TPA: F0F1 ATP synthase subunit A [Actinomycetes bacterium]|jgi:F-type H+-transporting ATPase subunit a|nr:F0F1 ATP synthase subunit A [Actinomycetes bacterium]
MSTLPTLLAAREGFKAPGMSEFNYDCYGWSRFLGPACLSRTSVLILFVTAVVAVLFLLAFRSPQVVPRGLQNVMEYGIDFVRRQIILEVVGNEGLRFLPYLVTLFYFVFFANILEIIPLINFPVTSRMALPGFLAIASWALFNWVGIRRQGLRGYLRSLIWPAGVPWYMLPLLAPIEFVSTEFVRPLTLSVRLLANMIAGHLILAVFFAGTVYLLVEPKTALFGVGAALVSVALVGFELLVSFLQAYIFTILTAVYIAGALEPDH